ncbi:MAG: hypothetical protein R2798_01080 [Chitinophagales bacterium]|nr:hypothetical protein [Chitinophagales bacterium]
MHEIEPYYNWRSKYIAEQDERSPFYGRTYNEFQYEQTIYNYYIHPQWDEIGSPTLYLKILFVDYSQRYCIIELFGEWNDCIHNDIMYFKQNVINALLKEGIVRFILIGENVLNFHYSDDSYYEDWYEDIKDDDGWIALINFREHVLEEMNRCGLQYYLHYGKILNDIPWRPLKPQKLYEGIDKLMIRKLEMG